MPISKRIPDYISRKTKIDSGPLLARVVGHLDPTRTGSLEVTLLRDQGNNIGDEAQTFIVKCASPFFGYTAYEYTGDNTVASGATPTAAFNDTQKSYGMWMVPPDVGVTVLVVFVDGKPDQGFWIGCIPSSFANNMVPGIAAAESVDLSAEDKRKYDTSLLPVAEINRRANAKNERQSNPDKIKKPVHPLADKLLTQGLLADNARGVTSSSSRREAPSMVFGISTPGPLDKTAGAKVGRIGTGSKQTNNFVSRLGGTQFVMDDGDDQFVRKTPASEGPPEYANVIDGEKGNNTIPKDECVRIRTRTGHQILMHNSEDLIYIGNAKGTTWVELTSNGKIDIYAEDSISIHTQQDLNIRADRDINMEAGRNFNLKALGRVQIESGADTNLIIGNDGKITTSNNLDVNTGEANKFTAGSSTDILTTDGDHTETANNIYMNSGPDNPATPASSAERLTTYPNPVTNPKEISWAGNRYQVTDQDLHSIMKRIPMHEPWANHENLNPAKARPNETDREQDDE